MKAGCVLCDPLWFLLVPKLILYFSARLSTACDRRDKSVEVKNIDISHCVVHFVVLYYADVLLCGFKYRISCQFYSSFYV